jgi:hypothetical protein
LGLCVSGHGDYEAWGPAQTEAVISQCVDWCRAYGIKPEMVLGHNETDEHGGPPVYKTCPGKLVDMTVIRAEVKCRMTSVFITQANPTFSTVRVDPAVDALRSLVAALEANQRALVTRIEDLEQRKP